MKKAKIALVAQWQGWCGACAAERPLVLTRTGQQSLRSWFAGTCDTRRPLTLTCRLCGVGVLVPCEEDDPPVLVEEDEAALTQARPWESGATEVVSVVESPAHDASAMLTELAGVVEQATVEHTRPPEVERPLERPLEVPDEAAEPSPTELDAARQTVATALGALLTERTAAASGRSVRAAPVVAPVAAVPLQREAAAGGLAELQLLADGIDLLSTGRA